MADTPLVTLSYASKDWRSLRDELFARAPLISQGRWTDLNTSDPGVTISELLVGMVDEMLFYLDNQTNEAMFKNAVQRANIINHLKLISYNVRGYQSSGGQVSFSVTPIAGISPR